MDQTLDGYTDKGRLYVRTEGPQGGGRRVGITQQNGLAQIPDGQWKVSLWTHVLGTRWVVLRDSLAAAVAAGNTWIEQASLPDDAELV